CAVCHGKEGKGNGPASSGLVPPPRNLVEGKWKQGGSSKDLFVTMEMGVPGTSMIGFAHLPKIQRWALVHYLRSITMNKVEDDLDELERFGQTAE
ncbi:MAG: cytochrome c, partial [Bdellovibrionales bacterium]|nr:cytochrome c [Bdellovibrionales bacterium]